MGRFKLPATSAEGVTSFENNRVSFRFEVAGGQRRLNVWFAGFDGGDDLTFEAVLDEEPRDSMVDRRYQGQNGHGVHLPPCGPSLGSIWWKGVWCRAASALRTS